MATTTAHLLAFFSLIINSALMLPCACCMGIEITTDACCATEFEPVVEAASCCSGGCCSTSHDASTHQSLESGSSLLPCLDASTTAICCCNDALTAAVNVGPTYIDHDLYSIDNAPVLPLALTPIVDITTMISAWPDLPLERSLVSSRSPCAMLQLFCIWLK